MGKELLARSLHLSGARRQGPFVVATCGGARPQQIEADLFGAEVPGKGGPVRREGKLLLAHGGTLFLDEVEQLPMELQARLVRFLRSGRWSRRGATRPRRWTCGIVAGSRAPLEAVVARDLFRVDLAYRLSQFTIEVPPAARPARGPAAPHPVVHQPVLPRDRQADAGDHGQGDVRAAQLRLSGQPGGAREHRPPARLHGAARPAGRHQPAPRAGAQRHARRPPRGSTPPRTSTSSAWSARAEQAAIREALRRTNGNKSQAARLLGLSRNGLAIKMERYGLKG